MYLSLPLPTPTRRPFALAVADAAGGAPPLRVALEAPRDGAVHDLLAALAALLEGGAPPTDAAGAAGGSAAAAGAATAAANTAAAAAATEPPDARYVLAQWSPAASGEKLELLDPSAPLSGVQPPPRGGFLSSFSSAKPAQLIAYRFDAAAGAPGPGAGRRPVVVFHRARGAQLAPPSLLFHAPPAVVEPAAVAAEAEAENAAAAPAAPGVAALAEMGTEPMPDAEDSLPIGAAPAPAPALSAPAPPAAPGAALGLPLVEWSGARGGWALAPGHALAHAVALAAAPLVRGAPASAAAAPAAAPPAAAPPAEGMDLDDAAADVAAALERPDTPERDMDAAPSSSDEGAAAAGAALAAAEPPLDIFAAAKGEASPFLLAASDMAVDAAPGAAVAPAAAAAAAVAAAAAPAEQPFVLAVANPSGVPRTSWTSAAPPDLAAGAAAGKPLYFCADWSEAAAAALDRARWEAPAAHASAAAADAAAAAAARGGGPAPPPPGLADCVEAFTRPECLGEADSWFCAACKAHVRATKKLDLWRLPEVLVVHLKRFSFSRHARDKLDAEVAFPLKGLDLRRFVPDVEGGSRPTPAAGAAAPAAAAPAAAAGAPAAAAAGAPDAAPAPAPAPAPPPPPPPLAADGFPPPADGGARPPPPLYDLFAVSNHYGGLGGGHYVAHARAPDTGAWHCFDDASVSEVQPAAVRGPSVYVLFYQRRGAAAPPGELAAMVAAAAAAAEAGGDAAEADGAPFGGRRTPRGPALAGVGEEEEGEDGGSGGKGAAAPPAAAAAAAVVVAAAAEGGADAAAAEGAAAEGAAPAADDILEGLESMEDVC
jgi:hypothetical protein